MPVVGISHLYASGAYSDSVKNNAERNVPRHRLDAWQRPGNLRQAGYIRISSYCRRRSEFASEFARPLVHGYLPAKEGCRSKYAPEGLWREGERDII